LVELENRGLFSCNEGSIQPEGNARHRMAANLVELRCHGELASEKFMSWSREKQNAVSKYPVAVSNQSQRAA
jgi:hypothetical protein